MLKKIQKYIDVEGIETLSGSNAGGVAASISGSTAAELTLRRTLADGTWQAVSGAFTGSNLSGFTQSTGTLTYTGKKAKTFFIYGQLSGYCDVNTRLRLALSKNGAVISASEGIGIFSASSDTGEVFPAGRVSVASRVYLSNTNTIRMEVLADTTGSNFWATTANLTVHQ